MFHLPRKMNLRRFRTIINLVVEMVIILGIIHRIRVAEVIGTLLISQIKLSLHRRIMILGIMRAIMRVKKMVGIGTRTLLSRARPKLLRITTLGTTQQTTKPKTIAMATAMAGIINLILEASRQITKVKTIMVGVVPTLRSQIKLSLWTLTLGKPPIIRVETLAMEMDGILSLILAIIALETIRLRTATVLVGVVNPILGITRMVHEVEGEIPSIRVPGTIRATTKVSVTVDLAISRIILVITPIASKLEEVTEGKILPTQILGATRETTSLRITAIMLAVVTLIL
jgi:hypothetical protein